MTGIEAHLLTLIKHVLSAIGYPGVFLLMTIEGFGIPIPSELTMPFSGFLTTSAGGHRFSLLPVIVTGAVGETVGGIVAYAVGYHGGRPILNRYGRLVFLSEEDLERGEEWSRRHGSWIVFVTRLLPAIRSFVALPAGVVRMPFWRFLVLGAIGSAIWCTALALLGHVLGLHWESVSSGLRRYNVVIIAIVILLIALGIYARVAKGRRKRRVSLAE